MATKQSTRTNASPESDDPITLRELGNRYDRLVVVAVEAPVKGRRHVLVRCDCGREKRVRLDGLMSGFVRSCGCYQQEMGSVQGLRNTVHGGCRRKAPKLSEYNIWNAMNQRCRNPSATSYPNYGGRGITVCDRWANSFAAFLEDMGFRPTPRHTIERIDNANGYGPGNCRWATYTEQGRNRRNNRILRLGDRSMSVPAWAEETGIPPATISARIRLGWSAERTLTEPVQTGRRKSKEDRACDASC